jgi:phage-related protein
VFRPGTSFIDNVESIVNWLQSAKGYARLEDSYDPTVYRMASYYPSGSMSNLYDKATTIEISFDCKPQRYLKMGEEPITYSGESDIKIQNPTIYTALPNINVKGLSTSSDDTLLLTITNYKGDAVSTVTLTNVQNGEVTIYSENATIVDSKGDNISSSVGFNGKELPKFEKEYSRLKIEKFKIKDSLFESFTNVLAKNNTKLEAKYTSDINH